MTYKQKKYAGFDFIEVGHFYESNDSHDVRWNGKNISINLCIKLIDPSICKIGESAYLILVEDDVMYAGEYSYNFEDRWLKKEKYV